MTKMFSLCPIFGAQGPVGWGMATCDETNRNRSKCEEIGPHLKAAATQLREK